MTDARTVIRCKLVRYPKENIMNHFCILLYILFGEGRWGGGAKGLVTTQCHKIYQIRGFKLRDFEF